MSRQPKMCRECGEDYHDGACKCDAPSSLAAMPGSASGVEAEVCADIAARQAKGIAKYGTTVEANPLSLEQWLQHAYEECLDQAVYLKKCIAVTKTPNDGADAPRTTGL